MTAVALSSASAVTSTESSPSPVESSEFSRPVALDDAVVLIEMLSSPLPVSIVELTAPFAIPVLISHEDSSSVQEPDLE